MIQGASSAEKLVSRWLDWFEDYNCGKGTRKVEAGTNLYALCMDSYVFLGRNDKPLLKDRSWEEKLKKDLERPQGAKP